MTPPKKPYRRSQKARIRRALWLQKQRKLVRPWSLFFPSEL
ncbi:MAG: hypothetical protein [Siphoviridae sp. ctpQM7]|nr:MAG: hypothetical protein [Siphoviridae sp. ctpQM7]